MSEAKNRLQSDPNAPLIALMMNGNIPVTPAMKCDKELEPQVQQTVGCIIRKK